MPVPILAVPDGADSDFVAHLRGLTPPIRLADYRAGLLSRHQLTLWATHYPDEVPLLNGELEWIALGLADLD